MSAAIGELLRGPHIERHYGTEHSNGGLITSLFPGTTEGWTKAKKFAQRLGLSVRHIRRGEKYVADIDKENGNITKNKVIHGEKVENGGDGKLHDPNEP